MSENIADDNLSPKAHARESVPHADGQPDREPADADGESDASESGEPEASESGEPEASESGEESEASESEASKSEASEAGEPEASESGEPEASESGKSKPPPVDPMLQALCADLRRPAFVEAGTKAFPPAAGWVPLLDRYARLRGRLQEAADLNPAPECESTMELDLDSITVEKRAVRVIPAFPKRLLDAFLKTCALQVQAGATPRVDEKLILAKRGSEEGNFIAIWGCEYVLARKELLEVLRGREWDVSAVEKITAERVFPADLPEAEERKLMQEHDSRHPSMQRWRFASLCCDLARLRPRKRGRARSDEEKKLKDDIAYVLACIVDSCSYGRAKPLSVRTLDPVRKVQRYRNNVRKGLRVWARYDGETAATLTYGDGVRLQQSAPETFKHNYTAEDFWLGIMSHVAALPRTLTPDALRAWAQAFVHAPRNGKRLPEGWVRLIAVGVLEDGLMLYAGSTVVYILDKRGLRAAAKLSEPAQKDHFLRWVFRFLEHLHAEYVKTGSDEDVAVYLTPHEHACVMAGVPTRQAFLQHFGLAVEPAPRPPRSADAIVIEDEGNARGRSEDGDEAPVARAPVLEEQVPVQGRRQSSHAAPRQSSRRPPSPASPAHVRMEVDDEVEEEEEEEAQSEEGQPQPEGERRRREAGRAMAKITRWKAQAKAKALKQHERLKRAFRAIRHHKGKVKTRDIQIRQLHRERRRIIPVLNKEFGMQIDTEESFSKASAKHIAATVSKWKALESKITQCCDPCKDLFAS